tara:strand:+ start:597 stop:1235 length:639 start_codon:yes stop_codon:yes gene_type:complete
MSQDARYLEIFGPKLGLETGNPQSGAFGKTAFSMNSTTDEGVKFVLAHHEAGTTRFNTGNDLLIEGAMNGNSDTPGVKVISHTGDLDIDSPEGTINLMANNQIVLEADKIILKANDIQIGDSASHGTKSITLNGDKIQVNGKTGNLPIHLKLGWISVIESLAGGLTGLQVGKTFPTSPKGLLKTAAKTYATSTLGPVGGEIARSAIDSAIED